MQTTTLFDFSDPRTFEAWYVVDDGVMGGLSRGTLRSEDGIARFSGVVRLENNGGFSSIQVQFRRADFSPFDGLLLRLRGDGRRYGVYLQNSFGPLMHQYDFDTQTNIWQDIPIPFAALRTYWWGQPVIAPPLNLRSIMTMNLITPDKEPGRFAIDLAAISLYR